MDISRAIAELKKEKDFTARVGMILVHNGVVRAWSRKETGDVGAVEIEVDQDRIRELCAEYQAKPGIFRVLAEARSGRYHPGDDLLFIIVAGDVRENVKPVLAEVLDRIKAEAVRKKEIFS